MKIAISVCVAKLNLYVNGNLIYVSLKQHLLLK